MDRTLHFKSAFRSISCCLSILFLISSFQKAAAATYYINDNDTKGDIYTTAIGNDSNDGTPSDPKLSIFNTYGIAKDGDTIIIDTGNYADLSEKGELLFPVAKKVTFVIAGVSDKVVSKNNLPKEIKINPTEIYLDNDKAIDRKAYLQKLQNKRSRKSQ